MEEIRRVAAAYYEHLPAKDKKLLRETFKAMDKNRDGKISLLEYLDYFKKKKGTDFTHQSICRALDMNVNGSLDFEEAIVLFYIMESGRTIICMSCKTFMAGVYFSCSQCFFNVAERSFDICCDCYGGKKFTHHGDAIFCDNFSLLSQSRSLALEASAEKQSRVVEGSNLILGVANLAMEGAPPSSVDDNVKRAGPRDPFCNYVEEKNDDSMICMFCQHRWASKIPISRFKWHLSGEKGHGVAICRGVTKEVQKKALKAMRGGDNRHKSTTCSINVNDRGISTCPQEQNIEHVDRNDSLEQTSLMESTSGGLVQPGTSASSTKLVGRAFEKNIIWSWLMDDKVSIIGIYGMGGNGKTTMLTNICNELLERHDISHSIYWVNVPQDFKIDRLQDLIAKRLDLNLSSKDDDLCRVVELAKELMIKQKWILILNDLWNSFDPQELGIPIPLNGSKFIMTTRSQMVCQQMNCQESIRVDRLSDEEAWTLFMERLGHDRQLSQKEQQIAKDVARECGGLPLGIVTLAESLKGVDDLHKWKITLKRLKESNFWEMEDQIFQILRLSYDCLDDSPKQCFVYCALFDESQKIERRELIESFIEEGIITEFDKGHSILDGLENVCLLERIDDGSAVKMHDLLRDMAIQILDDEYSLDMRAKEERG